MSQTSALKFGRTDTGYRLCVEGKGTMKESPPAETFVGEALALPEAVVVMDLHACNYLDSTFLGCLIGLHRKFGLQRFRVSAPPDKVKLLFGPTKLDMVLRVSAELPAIVGDYVTIAPSAVESRDMAAHIMECHRRLAEIPGPQQCAFAAIADKMARELEQRAQGQAK